MSKGKVSCLFIDDEFIESADGLVKGVIPAEKVSDVPLLKPDQPWEDGWYDRYGNSNVIYDEEEELFKAWYVVRIALSSARAEEADALAYAISKDGIHWEKPILNIIEDNGSKENNLVMPFFRWATGHGVIKDPIEADPSKRYKMLFLFQCEHMQFAGMTQPVCVAYSADGINWETPRAWVNPIIAEGTDTHLTTHWDSKLHRYVVYLRGRPNVRIICMSESDDYLNWTPREIIVQPDDEDPPQDHEFYGMTSMEYGDHRIGFMSIFHTLNENWISSNGIEDWMPDWMNRMDIQLTYSKDGRTWHRAGNREPILECGPWGSFDSGSVYASHSPIKVGDEIWLYYAGHVELHGEEPRHGEAMPGGLNLAKIKKDRLVCLKTEKKGVLTTTSLKIPQKKMGLPLGIDPKTLSINADARGGSVRLEIIDPFGRVLPGYSVDDCVPFTGDDTEHQVQWTSAPQAEGTASSSDELESKMVSQSRGILKARIYLENAKLFALYVNG